MLVEKDLMTIVPQGESNLLNLRTVRSGNKYRREKKFSCARPNQTQTSEYYQNAHLIQAYTRVYAPLCVALRPLTGPRRNTLPTLAINRNQSTIAIG